MSKRIMIVALLAAMAWPSASFAEGGTVGGTVGGAVVGGAVGGPVGAVVGGTIGAGVGTAIDPPPSEVRTYVLRERVPSVAVREEVAIGRPLPRKVKVYRVPRHRGYAYAIVNDQRVIVEPRTRRVIEIVR